MIKHFSADYIIPISGLPIHKGIVSVNDHGEIVNLSDYDSFQFSKDSIEHFEGVIVPGLINSHCHLELSHMLGKVPGGDGLIPFLTSVIKDRSAQEEIIIKAMVQADRDMEKNGIVAVGDISNNKLSKDIKSSSALYYHTFVEILGFDPEKASQLFKNGNELRKEFEPLPASLVPHAPYSVSKELLKLLQKNKEGHTELTSIHNQESSHENDLYRYKTGPFLDFYKNLKINIDFFKPQARNSLQSLLPLFPSLQRILLVHNTYTTLKDIYFAERFNRDVHWCFCPKANLYIEKRLPKIDIFLFHDFNITLGTDSLASNDKLCILSELKTLKENFPSLKFTQTIQWATLNGAKFLGIDKKYGSIEVGKTPGLNLITNTQGLEITSSSAIRRLI